MRFTENGTAPSALTAGRFMGMTNNHSLACRSTRSDLKRVVGERLFAARELNGYSQIHAAGLFGYKNPTQLSLWEQAKRLPPMKMLIEACSIYRVSMDYLVGISDDPDRDPKTVQRMAIVRSAEKTLSEMTHKLAEALVYQTNLGGPTIEAAMVFLEDAERMSAAYKGFAKINTKFQDMRGGATLAAAAVKLDAAVESARQIIGRHQRICDDATRGVIKTARPIESHPLFAIQTGEED